MYATLTKRKSVNGSTLGAANYRSIQRAFIHSFIHPMIEDIRFLEVFMTTLKKKRNDLKRYIAEQTLAYQTSEKRQQHLAIKKESRWFRAIATKS